MRYDFKKLKRARINKRMTQTELARRCGLSNGAVSQIEKGRGPWLKAIREMETVLEVNVIKTTKSA